MAAARRLPEWLGGGEVSELAYRIVTVAFDDPPQRPPGPTELALGAVTTRRVVDHLAERLDADEADVLRALAELERAGVITKGET